MKAIVCPIFLKRKFLVYNFLERKVYQEALVPGQKESSIPTYLFTDEKPSRAISFFPIKDRSFGYIHKICYRSRDESHQGTEYPTLGTVKECQYTASYIRPTSKVFDTVGICNAVCHPVRRCELIVPNPVVP